MEKSAQIFTGSMYKIFVKVSCCVTLLIGLSVVIGWQFEIAALKSILPNYITMKANTAIGLILLSIALYLRRSTKQTSVYKAIALGCLCLTGFIAITTLAEYILDKNFGIDELIFADSTGHTGKFPPGRLAPVTALIFLMLSLGAMVFDSPKEHVSRTANFLFFTSFLCAFQAFVAYCCGVTYESGSAFYTQMAVHTALATSLLALGFLAARPNKGFMVVITADSVGGYMARRLIALGTFAPPLINYLERAAHRSGLFDADLGVLVRVISNVVLFVIIAWRISSALHEADLKQKKTDKLNRDLEDVVQAQQVVKELNSAMEHALDGIAKISAAGRILMANRVMASILDGESTELLGKSWTQIADESELAVLNAMKEEMLHSGRAEAEVLGISRGPNKVYLHIVLVQVNASADNHGAAYLFAKDISVRKRDEAALSASRAQLAEAQRIAQIGSWSIDPRDNSITVSEEFYRIYGLDPNTTEAKRSVFQAAVHPEDRDQANSKAKTTQFKNGDSYRVDFRIVRPNGEVRHVHTRGRALLDSEGRSDKLVGTLQDVTELRLVEEELIAAREAALESSRLKSAFLANMSHEIRTPINGVIGMTSLLADTKLENDQREFVDAISRSAGALLVIINDILDVSKIEAGKLEIETVDFDLDEIISDVGKVASMEAKRKGLIFNVKSPGDLQHLLKGDPGRIRQVLMNLLSNAIKFTSKGKVELKVEQIFCDHTNSMQIRFMIHDSGIGIKEESLGKLFQPFTQADSSTTRRFGGTGLGLSICKQLVELMHGTIGATSKPNEGSTFWFTLPFKLGVVRNIPSHLAQNFAIKNLAGKRILIAEDNFINQKVAFGLLEKLGCKPHCVANGFEAISALREFTFDLILMDCQMPELDGFGATAEIRASGASWSNLPIIAMTANVVKGDRERCLEAGMNDYISKPVKIADLAAMLSKWLKNIEESPTIASFPEVKPDNFPTLDTKIIDEIRSFSDSTNDSVISDLFQSFLLTTPKILQHLRESCEIGQIKKLKFEAHSLKSASGALGAVKFSDICQRIEDSTDATDKRALRALITEANDEFAKAAKEMRDFLDKPTAVA